MPFRHVQVSGIVPMVGTWRWPLAGIALITIAAIVNNVLFTNVNLLTGRDPLATLSDLDRRISSPPVLSLATVRNPVLWASLSVWLPVLFSSGRRFTHTVLNSTCTGPLCLTNPFMTCSFQSRHWS